MRKIDFNDTSFLGFEDSEDILIDSGILLAYTNEYDAWHNTVDGLFQNFILNNDNPLFLYINPRIVDEVTHLAHKPLEQYLKKHSSESFTAIEISEAEKKVSNVIRELIENDILLVLDGNKASILQQIELYKKLGSTDALNVAIANEYGISFLTVDNKLVRNIEANSNKLNNIKNIYYTTSVHKTY
jgi:predicted nucleic acid-binding protein